MQREQRDDVRKERNGHRSTCKRRNANDSDKSWQLRSQQGHHPCGGQHGSCAVWGAILTSPVFNNPQEEITQECRKLGIELQTSWWRPPCEPGNRTSETLDGPSTKNSVDLDSDEGRVLDNVGAECNSHDDIVGHEPQTVVEANVFWMTARDTAPASLSLA